MAVPGQPLESASADPTLIASAGTAPDLVDELEATELPPSDVSARPGADAGLRAHARFFFAMRTNRLLYGTLVVFVVLRLLLARWSVADAVALAVLVAAYPFVEWSIHVLILHFKPKRIFGRTVDLGAAQNHRAHHLDPENPNKNLADSGRNIAVYVGGWAVPAVVLAVLTRQVGVFGTVLVYSMGIICFYEWFHYLIHSGYRSKNRIFRGMRRHHFLHHYRNESYWFGVAARFADRVLGTNPKPSAVPLSVTARDILPIDDAD